MNPWRARLAVLAVFVAGVVCGAAGLHAWRARFDRRGMGTPEGLARIVVHRLDRELRLSPAQRRQIYEATARARDEAAHVMEPLRPQMAAIFERLRGEIRAALTEEQRARFDRMVKEHAGRMPRLWMPPPHGEGPPGHHERPPAPPGAPPEADSTPPTPPR